LLDSITNDVEAVGARQHLFEFRNGIFGRDLGAFGFLLEKSIDIETREGFLSFP
jgi:hypothetical protein